jgi:hypothetical protein
MSWRPQRRPLAVGVVAVVVVEASDKEDGEPEAPMRKPSIPVAAVALVSLGLALIPASTVTAQQAGEKKEAKKSSEAAAKGGVVKLRDPFRPLLAGPGGGGDDLILPPGNRGLVIARLTITGVVSTTEGMIAVVNMQGRDRAYFLREGDEVYKGHVRRISEDSVVFMEKATDPFGTEYEREVAKQIPGSGAMQ